MHLTPRRRALVAVLMSWPAGYYYLYFSVLTATDVYRNLRVGYVPCDRTWRRYLNSCDTFRYNSLLAFAEVLVATALALGFAWMLARWVVRPIGELAATVHRFGPNALGVRLRSTGPRDETRRLADEIDAMLDRVSEGYEAQRRFAASASHELRTPLATQRALIEVSLGSALSEDQLALLSRQLLATNERNERLVDGLLTLAETERGLLAHTPLRLDAVVAEAVETLRPVAAEQRVELVVELAPVTVVGEQPLLDRLAGNLIGNAIKYNRPGGTVHVTVADGGTFAVANTGPAVPPEQVAGLFEPFRRLAGERLDSGGGVGLGLTIARSIVAAHGGVIEARARPGGGLAVEVRVPSC